MPDSSSLMFPGASETQEAASRYTRREFIKRVIASGAVASSASFVMGGLGGCTPRKAAVAGSVERLISIDVNGQLRASTFFPRKPWP